MISNQLLSHHPTPPPPTPRPTAKDTMARLPQAPAVPVRVLDWVTGGGGRIDRHKSFDNIPELSRG